MLETGKIILENFGICNFSMEGIKILFGIVCFREKFWETLSFRTLLSSAKSTNKQISIFIFDNTDNENWNIEEEYNPVNAYRLQYIHNPNNPGIAVAYNTIAKYAKDNQFSHIVFLDQDTELPPDFSLEYSKIAEKNTEFAIPLIFEKGKLLSPSIYKNYRSYFYDEIKDDVIKSENNSCINSGLMIKTDLFFKAGGYNEALRLDFCDHEFIKRVGKLTKSMNIIPIKLEQNFSTNTNSLDKALFRYALFTKDMKTFKKINHDDYKITLFVDIPHLIRLTLQYKSLAFIKQRFF